MKRHVVTQVGVLVGLFASAALLSDCGGKEASGPPVASPSFAVDRARAALGSPVEVTYRFVVTSGAPTLAEKYKAFVHFVDADGELMFTDDFEPNPPTTEWKPGQTIEHQHTLFIPIYPYVGEASVQMGLYSPRTEERLALVGEDQGQSEYRVGTIELLPQSENVFLIFKDGWHPAEIDPQNPNTEWQWTRRQATLAFRNPHRDSTFFLELDGRLGVFPEPQTVSVQIGEQVLDSFPITSSERMVRRIPISTAQLGGPDIVEIRIGVDKAFVPSQLADGASMDSRELGIRVFHAFIQTS